MIRLIKKTLNISNRHDYFGKFIIINIALCIIIICLSMKNEFSLRANAHLLVEMFISITTCGIFTLYRRNHSEFVFLVSPYSKLKNFNIVLLAAVIQNSLLLFVFIIQLLFAFRASFTISIVVSVIHFFYAIACGALVGVVIKQHKIGVIGLVLFYSTLFMDKQWTDLEMYRLFSPIGQLVNVGSLDVSNTISLIGLSILLLTICYTASSISARRITWKSGIIFFLGFLIVLSVGVAERYYNSRIRHCNYKKINVSQVEVSYRGVNEQEAETYGRWLSYIDDKLVENDMIKEKIHNLVIQRYFISPNFLPYLDEPMIPIEVKNGVMYINIFSKAMMIHSDVEFRYDMFQRMMYHYMSTTEMGRKAGATVLVFITEIIENPKNVFSEDMIKYSQRRGIHIQNLRNE